MYVFSIYDAPITVRPGIGRVQLCGYFKERTGKQDTRV